MVAPRDTVWTPKVTAKASQMWRDGKTYNEIIDYFGGIFSTGALKAKAAAHRDLFPAKMYRKPGKIEVDLAAIAVMWSRGLTSAQIAAETGLRAPFIRSLAQKNRALFPSRQSGGDRPGHKAKRSVKAKDPALDIKVQHMPLPASGTWKPIELDDYELERLPGVSMADNTGCKYPLTDTGPHCFCAAPKFQMKPYCAYHVVKCNPPGAGTGSERKAHKMK